MPPTWNCWVRAAIWSTRPAVRSSTRARWWPRCAAASIGGAALDVFDIEPLPAGHPLLSTPHTILSPHVGFVSRRAYEIGYGQAVEDILGWLDGDPVRVLNSSS